MTTDRALQRLEADLGELLARHEGGRDLDQFTRYRDRDHPLLSFIGEELGVELWERQVEMVRSVENNRRTVVVGANATGKDFAASCISLAWVFVYGGQVLVTASAERTAGDVFMRRQVAPRFGAAPQLPGELYSMELRVPGRPESGIIAMTSTSAAKIAGFHASRTLVVLTEANDVPEFAWESLVGGSAMGESDRVLAVGNPLSPEGRFYTVARSSHWTMIRIPASEHPNIVQEREVIPSGPSLEGRRALQQDWGADSPQFQARWEAQFPETAMDSLVEATWLEKAFQLHETGEFEHEARRTEAVVGLDVARFGRDASVACVRRGRQVVGFHRWQGEDTKETARRALQVVHDHHDPERAPVSTVVVDTVGVGAGVADQIRDEVRKVRWAVSDGWGGAKLRTAKLVEFKAGSKAPNADQFKRLRAQVFWRLRKELEEGRLALPRDEGLRRELLALRTEVTPDGKVALASKRAGLGGDSPDRADALAMTFRTDLKSGRKEVWFR